MRANFEKELVVVNKSGTDASQQQQVPDHERPFVLIKNKAKVGGQKTKKLNAE